MNRTISKGYAPVGLLLLVLTVALFSFHSTAVAQNIIVEEPVSPDEISVFYATDYNIVDASFDPEIFKYRISEASGNYPITIQLEFRMSIYSEYLGFLPESHLR